MPPDSQPLTRSACRTYLDETTFRLRPKTYHETYPKWPGAVGLEIEMLPVKPGAGLPTAVPLQGPGETSAAILRAEAARRNWRTEETTDDHGHPLLLKLELEDQDNISFEPGGQVEFSSRPYPCLGDAIKRMRAVQKLLDEAYSAHGLVFTQQGINPWHTVAELGLQMPKGRYRAMDRYYEKIGPYGQRMMRQTCTVQVNLDFGPDEATLARRYLAGQLLAPIATATFAYSPVVDRAISGAKTFRSRIWRHTDPTHTGLPGLAVLAKGAPRRDQCVDSYLEFALGAQVVFVTELGYKVPEKPVTFGQWLTTPIDGVRPTLADFATHLTLLFPEVRPRGFLELRSIDCQARPFEAVPAAYLTGLLYDDRALEGLLALLLPRSGEILALLNRAEAGLSDPELAGLAPRVMDLALAGFQALPPCFKAAGTERELAVFRELFTDQRRTPADALLEVAGHAPLTFASLSKLVEQWAKLTS